MNKDGLYINEEKIRDLTETEEEIIDKLYKEEENTNLKQALN